MNNQAFLLIVNELCSGTINVFYLDTEDHYSVAVRADGETVGKTSDSPEALEVFWRCMPPTEENIQYAARDGVSEESLGSWLTFRVFDGSSWTTRDLPSDRVLILNSL